MDREDEINRWGWSHRGVDDSRRFIDYPWSVFMTLAPLFTTTFIVASCLGNARMVTPFTVAVTVPVIASVMTSLAMASMITVLVGARRSRDHTANGNGKSKRH
jgi:hypothetical protein